MVSTYIHTLFWITVLMSELFDIFWLSQDKGGLLGTALAEVFYRPKELWKAPWHLHPSNIMIQGCSCIEAVRASLDTPINLSTWVSRTTDWGDTNHEMRILIMFDVFRWGMMKSFRQVSCQRLNAQESRSRIPTGGNTTATSSLTNSLASENWYVNSVGLVQSVDSQNKRCS